MRVCGMIWEIVSSKVVLNDRYVYGKCSVITPMSTVINFIFILFRVGILKEYFRGIYSIDNKEEKYMGHE